MGKAVTKIAYVLSWLMGAAGLFAAFTSIAGNVGDNVMQQSAGIVFGVALAVIPYVMARAVEKLFG